MLGNLIGTDAAGSAALPNLDGVTLRNASGNRIGGGPEEGNVIAGNHGIGVRLFHDGDGVDDNVIAGNRIGIESSGAALGNEGSGVSIDDGNRNLVGGLNPGKANTIAFNDDEGIQIDSGVENPLLGNAIYGNGELAIDLDADGVLNANDLLDVDLGANDLQNKPIGTTAVMGGGTATVDWTLGSEALTDYRIEFFAAYACDQSRVFLGAVEVTTDASGNAAGRAVLPSVPANFGGTKVTMTATKRDGVTGATLGTSELAACLATPRLP